MEITKKCLKKCILDGTSCQNRNTVIDRYKIMSKKNKFCHRKKFLSDKRFYCQRNSFLQKNVSITKISSYLSFWYRKLFLSQKKVSVLGQKFLSQKSFLLKTKVSVRKKLPSKKQVDKNLIYEHIVLSSSKGKCDIRNFHTFGGKFVQQKFTHFYGIFQKKSK